MSLYKFDQFIFNSTNYHLTHNGVTVSLRPKAMQLLALLVENRDRVVTKAEIFLAVWNSEYVRDHLLFQVISELRKPPFTSHVVRTIPNKGYQWNVAIKRYPTRPSIAAGLLVGMTCIASLLLVFSDPKSTPTLTQLPAHSAFSKGVIAMHSGAPKDAEKWFRFALNENPESVEATLFLAEVQFHQNKPLESLQTLQGLLVNPNLAAYNRMTATDLMSRIHQRQGKFHDALRYAHQSSKTNVVAQCSVDAVEGRIDMLERLMQLPVADSSETTIAGAEHHSSGLVNPNQLKTNNTSAPQLNVLEKIDENTNEHCQQLKNKGQDTSYCKPNNSYDLYVQASGFSRMRLA